MKLFKLIEQESSFNRKRVLCLASFSASVTIAIVALLNSSAAYLNNKLYSIYHFIIFLVLVTIYYLSNLKLSEELNANIQSTLHSIRIKIIELITKTELIDIEKINKEVIYDNLSKEISTISFSSLFIINLLQACITSAVGLFYLAYIDLSVAIVSLLFMGFTIYFASFKMRQCDAFLDDTNKQEQSFLSKTTDILEGFKEIKLNLSRANSLVTECGTQSKIIHDNTIFSKNRVSFIITFLTTCFFILIAIIILVIPQLMEMNQALVLELSAAIFFLFMPINQIVFGITHLSRAESSAQNLFELCNALPATIKDEHRCNLPDFDEITLSNLSFTYKKNVDTPFKLGPINFSFSRGQTLLISGDNGCGKTSLVYLIAGLYFPQDGCVKINHAVVNETNIQDYRNKFAAIFPDYHLFKKLYGLEECNKQKIIDNLNFMQLSEAIHVTENEFSTLKLSTGQRKRLALLVSLLEDKSIYIFDEWPVEQVASFKEAFYNEIVPSLKAKGKTVIIVSHDESYFQSCDMHIKMAKGLIKEINYLDKK
jgi:cyclic peptide transporter